MIKNLELKLEGKLPVTREELFILVSSWGREDIVINLYNDKIIEDNYKIKECYNLSNLDVSKIKDFSYIFFNSFYNGDLSKWDVSNAKTLDTMFYSSDFNNNSLNNWNVSNVFDMSDMFSFSKFNGDISKWDISNVDNLSCMFLSTNFDRDISLWQFKSDSNCDEIFYDNKNFENKYNFNNELPIKSKNFLSWFEKNREKIKNANVSKEEISDMNDYLNEFDSKNNINKEIKL